MKGAEGPIPEPAPIPTLPFGEWLRALEDSRRSGQGMDVPCGECRGCCTSAYFIPVGPDEKGALARIPKRLLFPAPGRPKGNFLLGYDEKGHCAMFKDNACSIYADRPLACRGYDCRVFAATGLSETDKPAIARQGERWRFAFPTGEDERLFAAARAAARFLREHADGFPAGFLPASATQQAALAIRVHALFRDDPGPGKVDPEDAGTKDAGIGDKGTGNAGRGEKPSGKRPAWAQERIAAILGIMGQEAGTDREIRPQARGGRGKGLGRAGTG